jgi:hypothetical protein
MIEATGQSTDDVNDVKFSGLFDVLFYFIFSKIFQYLIVSSSG